VKDMSFVIGICRQRDDVMGEVLVLVRAVSSIVMRIYATSFDVEFKGKNDPVTVADRESNAFLCEGLAKILPGIPIVAEESDAADFAGFEKADAAWFVDPLDGTREFVAKNGEFAVMVGLAEHGAATCGVVVCPALGRSFLGIVGEGAFEVAEDGARTKVSVSAVSRIAEARVVVSRSHRGAMLDAALAKLAAGSVVPTGSSGVKAVKVAAGEADVYIQPGKAGKRWDACAPEAIVRAAGGMMTDTRGNAFDYRSGELENSAGILATNGILHAPVAGVLASVAG